MRFQGFDFVVNDISPDPRSGNFFTSHLRQGVVDTNAEALIAKQLCENPGARTYCRTEGNTADSYNLSLRLSVSSGHPSDKAFIPTELS